MDYPIGYDFKDKYDAKTRIIDKCIDGNYLVYNFLTCSTYKVNPKSISERPKWEEPKYHYFIKYYSCSRKITQIAHCDSEKQFFDNLTYIKKRFFDVETYKILDKDFEKFKFTAF